MDRNLEQRRTIGKGHVELDFSFLTNNAASPLLSTLRGADGTVVASLVRNAAGDITVTLSRTVQARYVVTKDADLEDLNAGDDGAYATIGAVQNEGSSSVGMSFKVFTRSAAGAKTDYANRRVSVRLLLKNSTVGV